MHPLLGSELLLDGRFVAAGGGILHHLHLRRSEWLGFVEEAGDNRRVAIWTDQRVERLHEVPRGAVDLGLKARVDVMFRTASPTFSA